MGRYYSGDIEGKFWFGVQSSDDADFFGVTGEPAYLYYCFEKGDLLKIQSGIAKCLKALGEEKSKIDKFFDLNESYTTEKLSDDLNIPETKTKILLEWYARLDLGTKILECVKEHGECNFEADR
tara:strand:- start:64 stop:435 length:372 start_codon:yes stop_codon:yes gene_type:complete